MYGTMTISRRGGIAVIAASIGIGWALPASAVEPAINVQGGVVEATLSPRADRDHPIDYINAQPRQVPTSYKINENFVLEDMADNLLRSPRSKGSTGFSPGHEGSGKLSAEFLGQPAFNDSEESASFESSRETPAAHGTSNLPFSTARADGSTGVTNKIYPYRATGKLFAKIGSQTATCSASLIGKGIVVTAAHCIAEYGSNTVFSNVSFVPGYRKGQAPYGKWKVSKIYLSSNYLRGRDKCRVRGIVCENDVAVLTVEGSGRRYPGVRAGWYSVGWDKFGFTRRNLTHVTQLGYPACLDRGELMQRNDAQGTYTTRQAKNTVIGSLMCGGSSGGPWLVNFGAKPVLNDTSEPTAGLYNTVIGTTSWQSSRASKQMGASPFTRNNIVPLIDAACSATPGACS